MLNEKADAVYYHGSQAVLKDLTVQTAGTDTDKSTILVTNELEAAKRYYMTATTAAGLTKVVYDAAITPASWTELTGNGVEFTPTAGHKFIRVVEVDSSNKPQAVGDTLINVG